MTHPHMLMVLDETPKPPLRLHVHLQRQRAHEILVAARHGLTFGQPAKRRRR